MYVVGHSNQFQENLSMKAGYDIPISSIGYMTHLAYHKDEPDCFKKAEILKSITSEGSKQFSNKADNDYRAATMNEFYEMLKDDGRLKQPEEEVRSSNDKFNVSLKTRNNY